LQFFFGERNKGKKIYLKNFLEFFLVEKSFFFQSLKKKIKFVLFSNVKDFLSDVFPIYIHAKSNFKESIFLIYVEKFALAFDLLGLKAKETQKILNRNWNFRPNIFLSLFEENFFNLVKKPMLESFL